MSVTLGKTYSNGMVSMRRSVIQPQEGATLKDSLFATGEEALLASGVSSIMRPRELDDALTYGKPITADAARQQIKDAGLQLTVPDQGVTQDYLDILIDRKQEEHKRAEIINSAPQGAGATAARFGAGFAASMLDPLNVASAFIPVVGQAKYLQWLGKAGTFAKRTGVRAGVGAVEGTVGAAMVEPLIAMAKAEEQADYDSADSLANIAFGTVFGGGLHVMGGAGADLYRKVRGTTNPWDLPELKAGRDASAAIYDDINSQLLNAGRAADEAAADASIATSGFRSFADVSGVKLDDLYAEFGPRISFAREGEFAYANGPGLRTANQIADDIAAGRTFNQGGIGPVGYGLDERLEEPGNTPSVDWSAQDLQDSGKRVDAASVLKDYGPKNGKAVAYQAYIPAEFVPKERLVEEGDGDGDVGYDWSEFSMRGTFPPAKLRVKKDGKLEILDGNHRIRFWTENGANYIPAWIVDERRGASAQREEARTFDQAAYHGTPHKVDQFSLQKIGSGEGAQAYGWGLYFAGKREVAEHYRKTLSDVTSETGAVIVNGVKVEAFSPEGHAARLLFYNDAREIKAAAKRWMKEAREGALWAEDTAKKGGAKNAVEYYERLSVFLATHKRRDIQVVKGNLYKVELPEDSALLDNDAPISKQNEKVQDIAREFLRETGHLRAGENGPRQLSSSFAAAQMELGGMVKAKDGQALYEMLSKKLGSEQAASLYLAEHGIPGLRYKAGQIANVRGGGANYLIWDEAAIGAPESMYQMRGQDKRGSIDLAKGRRVNITLFQKADRSTFVHETGHLFLEVMDSLASRADAPEALKADLAKAREWMGLKDGEAIGEKQHEQFARGFEAYLREGKAPTPKLTKIFERFADWLVKIYKDIRALDVTLSDDVRGVYDRIIAGYPAAKKVELAGPVKREAALKAAVAQAVTGRKVDVEGIINGDQREVMRAAKNPEQALSEPLPEPLKIEDDDTGIESARESLGEIEALIKASDDEAVIRELDDLDEIVAQAKTWGRVAKKLAPCIGRTDG